MMQQDTGLPASPHRHHQRGLMRGCICGARTRKETSSNCTLLRHGDALAWCVEEFAFQPSYTIEWLTGSALFGQRDSDRGVVCHHNGCRTRPDPIHGRRPAFEKNNARLSIGHIDYKCELVLLGKNLTNTLTLYPNSDQPLVTGNGCAQTDRSRSFAVQASIKF